MGLLPKKGDQVLTFASLIRGHGGIKKMQSLFISLAGAACKHPHFRYELFANIRTPRPELNANEPALFANKKYGLFQMKGVVGY